MLHKILKKKSKKKQNMRSDLLISNALTAIAHFVNNYTNSKIKERSIILKRGKCNKKLLILIHLVISNVMLAI